MAAHNSHTDLPGYNEGQILHDGCPECEERGASVDYALTKLDTHQFARAWKRAATLQLHGLPGASHAEVPMLRALAMVQVQLERYGLPIGLLPSMVLVDMNGTLLEARRGDTGLVTPPEQGQPSGVVGS